MWEYHGYRGIKSATGKHVVTALFVSYRQKNIKSVTVTRKIESQNLRDFP